MTLPVLLVSVGTFALAWLSTRWAIALATQKNLLDHPNHRSSHVRATPRGGGIAIVLALYAGTTALYAMDLVPGQLLLALACGLPVAIVGYVDDIISLSARVRLLVQALCTAALLWLAAPLPELSFGSYVIPAPAAAVLYGVGIIWLTNLYNFMDGIDGIASGQAIAAGAVWALGAPFAAPAALVLIGAVAGFLRHNWPPARIFMGDVGSGFCGFTLGALALIWARDSNTPIIWWLIPLAPFISDATTTLVVRILRGKRPGVAHRSHAYQHLARRFNAHLPVTLIYTSISTLFAGTLFWWASAEPIQRALPALLACTVPLCVVAALLGAGRD